VIFERTAMDTSVFILGVFVGFISACLAIAGLSAVLRASQVTHAIEAQGPADSPPAMPASYELSEANSDAERLAHALESGLRAGWPFNFKITYALARHHERTDRREVEPSPRLN
jgi:hypothetical protein